MRGLRSQLCFVILALIRLHFTLQARGLALQFFDLPPKLTFTGLSYLKTCQFLTQSGYFDFERGVFIGNGLKFGFQTLGAVQFGLNAFQLVSFVGQIWTCRGLMPLL